MKTSLSFILSQIMLQTITLARPIYRFSKSFQVKSATVAEYKKISDSTSNAICY